MSVSSSSSASSGGLGDAHSLPEWLRNAQDGFFLTMVVLAEMYLLGTGGAIGWVPNIDNIGSWGFWHGVGVIIFFLACGGAAGVALGLSVAAFTSFKRGERGLGAFQIFVAFVFMAIEYWINISERSVNLAPTPLDKWFFGHINVPLNTPFTPTLLCVGLLLPLTILAYGFARTPKVSMSPEEVRQQGELKRARMEEEAKNRMLKADMGRKETLVSKGQLSLAELEAQERAEQARLNGETTPTNDDDPTPPPSGGYAVPAPASTPLSTTIPASYWTARDLMNYVSTQFGVTIGNDQARAAIQAQKSARQWTGAPGQPWVAQKSALRKWAQNRYGNDTLALQDFATMPVASAVNE